MNSSNENEEMNKGHSLEKLEEKADTTKSEEGSAISDLLHVLGLRRNISGKLPSDSQAPPSDPISSDIPAISDPIASIGSAVEADDTKNGLPIDNQENMTAGVASSDKETCFPDDVTQVRRKPRAKKIALIGLVALIVAAGLLYVLPYLMEPRPPGADVVASYSGKNVTIEELKSFIALEKAKETEHAVCDKHGYDHTKCTSDEKCEAHPIDSIEGYRQMATNLAVEQIIQNQAASKGVTQRQDVQHGIKDLLDDANVSQLIEQLHKEEINPESISSWEVQQYYDNNRETYRGKSLAEVENEIRNILVSQKDKDFLGTYIEKLKQTAGLQVNFDLLKVSEPTDEEISAYYNQNISKYRVAEKAEVLEIKITADDAQGRATDAIRKIRSGEGFDSVAAAYGQNGQANNLSLEKGSGNAATEATIWKMQPGDISDPIANTDGSYSIVKLASISKAGAKPLSGVQSDIRLAILKSNLEEEYGLRKNEALFSVHSRQYTLGDFYTEFKELSSQYQEQFSTFEKKKQLVEQLIAKELLLEKTGDNSSDKTAQHSYDELKIQYLAQILHKQGVDDKLTDPTEAEMKQFYEDNKKNFIVPAGVRISLIWIDQGQNGEKAEQAKKKASEALSLLNKGTDFAEVAKKYSEDGTAGSGGKIDDIYYRDYLPEELGTVAFNLKVGETSDIIDYNFGFYILKVREQTKESQKTYQESTEIIKEYLSEQKHGKLESEMEQDLLKNAEFTVYDTTLRRLLKEQNK